MDWLKTTLKIVVILLGAWLLWSAVQLLLFGGLLYVFSLFGLDLENDMLAVGLFGGAAFVAFSWLPIKWPGSFDFSATRFIAASPKQIWNEAFPRARTEYFQTVIDRIDEVDGEPNQFRYTASTLGLPDEKPDHYVIEVGAAKPHEAFITKAVDFNGLPDWLKKVEWTAWNFVPVEGGTEVTITERISKPGFTAMLILFVFGPARDTLIQLRARCEGRKDRSLAGLITLLIERDAEVKAEGGSMAINGLTFWMILLGIIVPTIFVCGLVWFILKIAT